MRILPAMVLLGALACALTPTTSGQGHDHAAGSGFVVVHDLPPSGQTYVGALNHFGVLVVGDDHVPDFHSDAPVRVLQDGVVVYETNDVSGHDYDGVATFDLVFWKEGPYEVQALDAEGNVADAFLGNVSAGPAVSTSATFSFGYALPFFLGERAQEMTIGAPGHNDALWEARANGRVVLAAKTHGHDGVHRLDMGPLGPLTSTWSEVYQASPSQDGFLPFGFDHPAAAPGTLAQTGPVTPGVPPTDQPPATSNAVINAAAPAPYELIGTYDPWTSVGPDTLQHLSVLVVDPATGRPVQHVDFTARLVDAAGRVHVASDTLHEYDGILELALATGQPGLFVLEATATYDDWSASIRMPYTVLPARNPPATPLPGALEYLLEKPAAIRAGEPADFVLAGTVGVLPFDHTDALVEVTGGPAGNASSLLLRAKLHTHDDGRTPFTLAFPVPGTYQLRASPSPLEPRAVALGAAPVFEIVVGEPATRPASTPDDPANEAPFPAWLLVVALALAFAARRK